MKQSLKTREELIKTFPEITRVLIKQGNEIDAELRKLTQQRAETREVEEQASISELQYPLFARANQIKNQMVRVNVARQAVNEEMYGFCCICGDEIDLKRLNRMPLSISCNSCASLKEYEDHIYKKTTLS